MDGTFFMQVIGRYGMAAVFVIVALEYACFPVPSEIVLPFAGAAAAASGVGFPAVFALSVAAGLTGCFICYALGYFGGGALMQRMTRRFPKSEKGLEKTRLWFLKHGGISVLIGRVLPLFRTYISFFAGVSRQNPAVFAALSAAGISLWNAALVGLGFKLGQNWTRVSLYARRYQYILIPVVFLLIFAAVCKVRNNIKNGG